RRDLKLWLNEAYPVILVVYAAKQNKAYCLEMQSYFADVPTADLFRAAETIRVRLPVVNRLGRRSVRAIIGNKNELHESFQRRISSHVGAAHQVFQSAT